VKRGGALVVVDDDSDPYNKVREWWNSNGNHFATPREHLFGLMGISETNFSGGTNLVKVRKGSVTWVRESPESFSEEADGDTRLIEWLKSAAASVQLSWHETNRFILRRGPYIVAAGLAESVPGEPTVLNGHFVNLFDADLHAQTNFTIATGQRYFLLDLDEVGSRQPKVLASACKVLPLQTAADEFSWTVEGVANTPAVVLLKASGTPAKVTLDGAAVSDFRYADGLLWIRFDNEARPRQLTLKF